ncbi:MAG: cold shock domain-containing protein [Patescibacteria group bacterium]
MCKKREKSSRFSISFAILFTQVLNAMNGTIKTLTDRGFGFIAAEGQEKDLFFHSNALVDVQFNELREGDAVTFETENSPKGINAVNVRRA